METNIIINGDTLTELKKFPDESIDCVMTSPPYWALRNYHVEGQLGLEKTYDEYLEKMFAIFDEIKRILKKEGTCWVNLGDSYLGSNQGYGDNKERKSLQNSTDGYFSSSERKSPLSFYQSQAKSLALIPMRFCIGMTERGWLLRNDIVWYKRNSMPTSVKDRFGNKWEHLFFFVKSKKYYFNIDSVRKPHKAESINRINAGFSPAVSFNYRVREAVKGTLEPNFGSRYPATEQEKSKYASLSLDEAEKSGSRRARTVRTQKFITPEQTKETIEKTGWIGGSGRIRSFFDNFGGKCNPKGGNPGDVMQIDEEPSDFWDITTQPHPFAHFACYPERLCETPIKAGCPEGGIVLDPFMGSGTTGLVALKLNRKFIGIELNLDYIKIANDRLKPYLAQSKLPV